jgi:hypothetical protein
MKTELATLNSQIVSEIDSLAEFWKSAAAVEYTVAAPAKSEGKRKRGPRRRTKTPPPAASL